MGFSAAEPGLSVDADVQVGAQSGAAPTAEGKINTVCFIHLPKPLKLANQYVICYISIQK